MARLKLWFVTLAFLAGLAACSRPAAAPTPAAPGLSSYPNAALLVETDWLADHLTDGDLLVVDARPVENYEAGHIPGAVSLPVGDTFDPEGPPSMLAPLASLGPLLGSRGISSQVRVVVYDTGKATNAARLFWTLEAVGQPRVALLNGGIARWRSEGFPLATDKVVPPPVQFIPQFNPELVADLAEMKSIIGREDVAIVDARSPREFRGQDVYAQRGGHIPGSVNIEWSALFTEGEAPVLKPAAALAQIYEGAGVTRDQMVFTLCQTGQRASVAYFTLRLLGYEKVSLYDGSWQEWGNQPDGPIEK